MSAHSPEEWSTLCEQTKQAVPADIGSDAWSVLIACILSASTSPELVAEFYTHLTTHGPEYSSSEAVQRLSLRFRDVLLKQITLIGAPQVIMALTPLSRAQGDPEAKAQESELNPKWNDISVEPIHARGVDTIHSIYGRDLLHNRIFPTWGSNTADMQFAELFTVYGMYLSDFEVLSAIETETIVFATISCLGFRGPSLWHLRGLGRLLGARGTDETTKEVAKVKDALRAIKVAIMTVVEFVGPEFERRAKIETWPNVGDVTRDLGGWGEDA